jgi:hypothetical protein
MSEPNRLVLHRALAAGEFHRLALQRALDIVRALLLQEESQGTAFVARRSTTLLRFRTLEELRAEVRAGLNQLQPRMKEAGHEAKFRRFEGQFDAALKAIDAGEGNGLRLLLAFNDLLCLETEFLGPGGPQSSDQSCRLTADEGDVYFYVEDQRLEKSAGWNERLADMQFVASAGQLLAQVRAANRAPTAAETAIVQAAYELLARGTPVPLPFRPLGVPGFKPRQTLLFNTDPGEGHLRVTCRRPELLPGSAVHIEHIDRDEGGDRERVEPYRLPAALNAAKVRLHIGNAAPCSAYIGRPVFENYKPNDPDFFAVDELKSAHMTASACTAMFVNGVVDCKIGIERMTARQAVRFMRAVVGNVFRDPRRQYLSAAFNIHTPILDDREATVQANGNKPRQIDPDKPEDLRLLCLLAIELVAEGGFDKVTWDGSDSRHFPSVPVLEQVPHEFIVELVHRAHERGLTTYVSAGLEARHMPQAVAAGLDGVGIGIKLHYIDTEKRRIGELRAEEIQGVLEAARAAEAGLLGRGAKLLARLDRLAFEKCLAAPVDARRKDLLGAMQKRDEQGVSKLLDELSGYAKLPDDEDGMHPLVAQTRRLVLVRAMSRGGFEAKRPPLTSEELGHVRAELGLRDLGTLESVLRDTPD